MHARFSVFDRELGVTTSIGIAVRRPGETDPGVLLRRADHGLYQAKAAGRNGYAVGAY